MPWIRIHHVYRWRPEPARRGSSDRQGVSASAELPDRRRAAGRAGSLRNLGRLSFRLSLLLQILVDLDMPLLVGDGGVDLDLEAVSHVRRDIRDVDVELLIPPPHLVYGAVFFDEQWVVDPSLVLPDFDVLQEAFADALGEDPRQLLGHLFVHALGLFDDDAPLQHERVLGNRVVAVDQDRLGLVVAVFVVQPVDHERRAEVGRLGIQVRFTVRGAQIVDVGTADVVQILRGDVAFENVLEVRGQTEVDVEEVGHVGDVVDDVAAVGALDQGRVPPPFGPLVAGRLGNLRDLPLGLRRVLFMVVPDEQQPATHVGRPGPGTGQPRRALGVGHQLALAVATPAPVVERASDLVTLDGALRQVAAHVPAVAVQHVHVAVRVGEYDQVRAKRLDSVGLAVQVVPDRAKAVPAPGIPVGQGAGVDLAYTGSLGSHDTSRFLGF